MAAFFSANVDLASGSVEIVTSVDFDRRVQLHFPSGGSGVVVRVGFTSSEVDSANEGFPINTAGGTGVVLVNDLDLLLPADESLWARADGSGSKVVDVLVTKAWSN